jgi:hypothetical protein
MLLMSNLLALGPGSLGFVRVGVTVIRPTG